MPQDRYRDLEHIIKTFTSEERPAAAHTEIPVPAYIIPRQDALLIQAVAHEMGMDAVQFAQLAPYLYARDNVSNGELLRKMLGRLIAAHAAGDNL